jgi:ribosomal protein S6E (S10)
MILQIFRITGGNDKQGFPMKQGVVCLAFTRFMSQIYFV